MSDWIIHRDESLMHKGVPGMRKGYRKDGKPSKFIPKAKQLGENKLHEKRKKVDGLNETGRKVLDSIISKKDKMKNKSNSISKSSSYSKGSASVKRILNRNETT